MRQWRCSRRSFDDDSQPRIHVEAEAILWILTQARSEGWQWVGSVVLLDEIDRMPDPERKIRVQLLMQDLSRVVPFSRAVAARGEELESLGFKAYDALHIASAEAVDADVLLTTDDRMAKRAHREADKLGIAVMNPVDWLREEKP